MASAFLNTCVSVTCLCAALVVFADESDFAKRKAAMLSSFNESKQTQLQQFADAKAQYLSSFNEIKQQLAKHWDRPELSNKTTWVAYNEQQTRKRSVDFETGALVIELIDANADINEVLEQELNELSSATRVKAVKDDLVLAKLDTKKVTDSHKIFPNLDKVALKASANVSVIKQKNGKTVTRIKMTIDDKDLLDSAKVYLPQVNKVAEKWQIDRDLIMAITHTESHFNPVAQSHIPAYGLMQIVPSSAGRDVTKRYLNSDKILTTSVLFNPDFNLDIGAAYLNILHQHYLKAVKNPQTKEYLAIAAYNGGIGSVAKHFTGKTSLKGLAMKVNTMSEQQVLNSLMQDFPFKETRHYLSKVTRHKKHYQQTL